MSHHPSNRRSRARRSAGGSASSQSAPASQRARPTAQRGVDRARPSGQGRHPGRTQERRGDSERPGRLRASVKRRRRGRGGSVLAFLRSPLGVVLGAFLVTLLVGLIALRAAGSSLSGLINLGRQTSGATSSAPTPLAPDASGFDASRIIDDEVFYDADAMTREEIATFVTRVNAGCQPGSDGTECLASATFSMPAREATTFCPGGIEAASGLSAADVVWQVSQACDINPQVLLVLIHKEQGLLTASGQSLSARDYEAAAGYACPDQGTCDPQWAGFSSQLYGAASQFQRYRLNPGTYDVVAQRPTQIAFSPDAQCGSSELTVTNQATAGLYNYTPFQPNEAAGSGGDQCTSWGNWNFYGYFKTLFGSPTSD
ncbi:hemagglutinin [Actinomyces viscosus]|uniref:hemagglutinin n=1 Tax=Actinomyces viscosus TaxID=1656 RepID=UPI0028E7C5E1|nr:hemagglutinin [Actinomyces viscosus]